MKSLILFVLLISNIAFANDLEKASGAVLTDKKTMWGLSPGESLVKPLLNKYVVNEMIDLRPIEGHHFNLEANNNCNKTKPVTLTEGFMQCQFEESGTYKINVYICDDKKSFCKFEKIDVLITAPRGYQKALRKRVSSNILYVPKAELSAPPGFIKNRDQYAISQAKKKNQPLLIVFSAQWCPACNMLYENVFQTKKFQDETKNVVKLIMDVDSDISWDLKEKFKVGGYPTTVLTTSTLNEIGRFVGYRNVSSVSSWMTEHVALKDNPIELVASKAEKGVALEKDLTRLSKWYIELGESEKAKALLTKSTSDEAKKLTLIAEYKTLEKQDKNEEAAKTLLKLIEQSPKDIWLSSWALSLSEKDPELAKKKVDVVKTNVSEWVASSEMDSAEFTRAELHYNLGQFYDNIDESLLSRQSFISCADDYKKISENSQLKTPRGAQMERGFCLVKAGMNEEALKIFESLVKVYKTEFAFNYYYAKSLFDTGSTDKAYQYVKSAYEGSYGDNMLRAAALKAQIEIEQKKLNLAEITVTKTLEKVYLPSTTQIRSHRYVANLKSVLAKIQIQKEALKEKK